MKNKHKIYFFMFFSCLATGFFIFAQNIYASNPPLIINEFLLNGVDATEFVELYNTTDSTIALNGYYFNYYSSNRTWDKPYRSKPFPATAEIKAKGFYIIGFKNSESFANWQPYLTEQLSNSDGSIAIFPNTLFNQENAIDFISWGNVDYIGKSIELIIPKEKYKSLEKMATNDFWQESYINNGTPGKENFTDTDIAPPEIPAAEPEEIPEVSSGTNTVRINEVLPSPKGSDKDGEYIELYNFGDQEINLSEWKIKDQVGDAKNDKWKIIATPKATKIPATGYLVLKRDATSFSLSSADRIILLNLKEEVIDEVSYNGAKEAVSYNFDGSVWRWSKFLTPGTENVFNNLPQSKNSVPKNIYVNTYAEFSAKGSDKDNDKLKYTWDFGDGHKSYLPKTRHKYARTGKYSVSLKINDGSEDEIKTFEIAVEKFPKLSVKIVGLSPNPIGADTGIEYLEIKNNTKKKINLKNWGIASGTKNLTNHPIVEDFFIKAGKVAQLTYATSKFTLPNTRGKVELHYPNGKVASHVSYGDKKKTAIEGAVYEKTKSGWKWNIPAKKNDDAIDPLPIAKDNVSRPMVAVKKNSAATALIPEIPKNLNQSTLSPVWQKKKALRFALLNFGLGIKTVQALSAENARPVKDYPPLKNLPVQKHWAIKVLESLNVRTNYFLNTLFSINNIGLP